MSRRSFKRKHISPGKYKPDPGSAPGVLIHNPHAPASELMVIGYGSGGYVEQICTTLEEIEKIAQSWPVLWVSIIGLGTLDMIEKIGKFFSIDRFSLEDVIDTSHRSKVEYYSDYVFAILKAMDITDQVETEQISLVLKKNVVIVFEEKPGSSFTQVRERIRRGTGKIRSSGTDYLFYALLDEVIDKYFPILDKLNQQLAGLEDEVMTSANHAMTKDLIQKVHHAKTDMLIMHKTIWPVSEIISTIIREETPLISSPVRSYLRDCFDHSTQANELTQFYRDTASGLLNTYLAYEGHKTNEIVKVLTMVSAVFIPLNFIAGVYGMNFKPEDSPYNMPELTWRYGYPYALSMMLIVALLMMVYFKRRGWLSNKKS